MARISVVIADDQPLFIKGLLALFSSKDSTYEVLATYQSGKKLLQEMEQRQVDLLILDLSLLDTNGLDVIKTLKAAEQTPRILVFSRYNQSGIIKSAFQYGADGYLLKSEDEKTLFDAIQDIITGKTYLEKQVRKRYSRHSSRRSFEDRFIRKYDLTKREIEVLRLITEALSNKEIAKTLFISAQTVSVHRKNIMRKLGVSNAAGILKAAYEDNLV